ncbi:MAG: hypothetical protein ACRC03_05245 [Romboutsia sp.]
MIDFIILTNGTDIKEKRKLLNEIKNTCTEFISIIEDTLSQDLDIYAELGEDEPIIFDDEISQAIADVIDAPVIDDDKIYTRFLRK